mgnify:CR=1 FL=1
MKVGDWVIAIGNIYNKEMLGRISNIEQEDWEGLLRHKVDFTISGGTPGIWAEIVRKATPQEIVTAKLKR